MLIFKENLSVQSYGSTMSSRVYLVEHFEASSSDFPTEIGVIIFQKKVGRWAPCLESCTKLLIKTIFQKGIANNYLKGMIHKYFQVIIYLFFSSELYDQDINTIE